MALYQKVNGTWVQANKVYLKVNGIYRLVSDVYAKDPASHTWKSSYHHDYEPPNPPELDLQVVEDFTIIKNVKTLTTRYFRVGTRLPGSSNDPDARLIRVLTTYAGAAPNSYNGATFHSTPDKNYSREPWSEWRYNSYGAHADTSVTNWKQYPVNAAAGTKIKGDSDYWFTAWSLDNEGNWSVPTPVKYHTEKDSVKTDNVVIKEARFQPNNSGSWTNTGFQTGNLIQNNNPLSVGLWLYGNQFTDSIGKQGTPTIRSASIRIVRTDDDPLGAAAANLYLFWTANGTPGDLTVGQGIGKTDIKKLGAPLAKGQAAWYDLPASFYADLNQNIKSIGLDYKDPVFAAVQPADRSTVQAVATDLRCGEVHVVWEEALG